MVTVPKTFTALEIRLEGGVYQIAIDKRAGRWEWQASHYEPGNPASHRVIDRGSAETQRQAVHRSTGIVMNHGGANGGG